MPRLDSDTPRQSKLQPFEGEKPEPKEKEPRSTGPTRTPPNYSRGGSGSGTSGASSRDPRASQPAPAPEYSNKEPVLTGGMDPSEFMSSAPATRELTDAEYKALSPAERAGVDFNTVLAAAVKADLKEAKASGKKSPAAMPRASWDPAAKAETTDYAPRTAKLLASLGDAGKGVTLDDMLQLKTGILDSDLGFLNLPDFDLGSSSEREAPGAELVSSQKALSQQFEKAMNKGSGDGGMKDQRDALLGLPKVSGFGTSAEDLRFQEVFDYLARPLTPQQKDELLNVVLPKTFSPEVEARFWQYVDARSKDAGLKSQPLGTTDGAMYLDPAEFRKIYLGGE